MRILVSACLLGYNCKYNGKNNYNSKIVELLKKAEDDGTFYDSLYKLYVLIGIAKGVDDINNKYGGNVIIPASIKLIGKKNSRKKLY